MRPDPTGVFLAGRRRLAKRNCHVQQCDQFSCMKMQKNFDRSTTRKPPDSGGFLRSEDPTCPDNLETFRAFRTAMAPLPAILIAVAVHVALKTAEAMPPPAVLAAHAGQHRQPTLLAVV